MSALPTSVNETIAKMNDLKLGAATPSAAATSTTAASTTSTAAATASKPAETGKVDVKTSAESEADLKARYARLEEEYNAYAASQKGFQAPVAHISIDETTRNDHVEVYIDVAHEGYQYHLETIKEAHIPWVSENIDSKPNVRAKYVDGKTRTLAQTTDRNKTLRQRFEKDPKTGKPLDEGCNMHGGFLVRDAETDKPLGVVNVGRGDKKKESEMAFLNDEETWSHTKDGIVKTYTSSSVTAAKKMYKGIATVEVSTMLQYVAHLKSKGYKIDGVAVEEMIGTARTDNPGSWKAMAKNGMKLRPTNPIDRNPSYGPEDRYQLRIKI